MRKAASTPSQSARAARANVAEPSKPSLCAAPSIVQALLAQYDTNGDGKLDMNDVAALLAQLDLNVGVYFVDVNQICFLFRRILFVL